MIFQIPTTPNGSPSWIQRTTLDGVDYLLAFAWSQRDGHWRMDVLDADQNPIALGKKLVTNSSLLRGVTDTRRPPGILLVVDTTDVNDVDPGFRGLGTRFALVYGDAAEIAADTASS